MINVILLIIWAILLSVGIYIMLTHKSSDEFGVGLALTIIFGIVSLINWTIAIGQYHDEINFQELICASIKQIPIYEKEEAAARSLLAEYTEKYTKVDISIFKSIGPRDSKPGKGGVNIQAAAAKYPEIKHNETLKQLVEHVSRLISVRHNAMLGIESYLKELKVARRSLWRLFHPKKSAEEIDNTGGINEPQELYKNNNDHIGNSSITGNT